MSQRKFNLGLCIFGKWKGFSWAVSVDLQISFPSASGPERCFSSIPSYPKRRLSYFSLYFAGHSSRMPEESSPRKTPQNVPYQDLPHMVNADGQYLFCRYWKPAATPRWALLRGAFIVCEYLRPNLFSMVAVYILLNVNQHSRFLPQEISHAEASTVVFLSMSWSFLLKYCTGA